MEHLRQEPYLRSLVRIVLSEFQHKLERSSLPGCVVGTEDDRLPHHDVRVHRGTCDTGWWVILKSFPFFILFCGDLFGLVWFVRWEIVEDGDQLYEEIMVIRVSERWYGDR